MQKERIQLTGDMYVEMYKFSDYVSCVEVFWNGKSYNAFCSDHELIEEWKENPDQLIQLCNDHLKNQPSKPHEMDAAQRKSVGDGIEVESYAFSDDIYCFNVFQDGMLKTSFCADHASVEEWEEDDGAMLSAIKAIMK